MPLAINWLLVGPREVTSRPKAAAMSPDRCGPGPSSANCSEVPLLDRGQPIEPHSKEALIQSRHGGGRCILHVHVTDAIQRT